MEEIKTLEDMDFNVAMSPTPNFDVLPVKTFSFSGCIPYLCAGERIHKLSWKDREYYGVLRGGLLHIHKPTGSIHLWILNDGDLLGDDYIIL